MAPRRYVPPHKRGARRAAAAVSSASTVTVQSEGVEEVKEEVKVEVKEMESGGVMPSDCKPAKCVENLEPCRRLGPSAPLNVRKCSMRKSLRLCSAKREEEAIGRRKTGLGGT